MRAAVLVEPGRIEIEQRPVPSACAGRRADPGVVGRGLRVRYALLPPWPDRRASSSTRRWCSATKRQARSSASASRSTRSRIGQRVSIEPQRPDPDSAETRRGRLQPVPAHAVLRHAAGRRRTVRLRDHRRGVRPPGARTASPTMPPRCANRCRSGSRRFARRASTVDLGCSSPAPDPSASWWSRSRAPTARPTSSCATRTSRAASRQVTFGRDRRARPHGRRLGSGLDAFIDASGAPAAVTDGIRALRPAGTVVLVGSGAESMELPTQLIQNRELVLTGVFRYANTWPRRSRWSSPAAWIWTPW